MELELKVRSLHKRSEVDPVEDLHPYLRRTPVKTQRCRVPEVVPEHLLRHDQEADVVHQRDPGVLAVHRYL